MNRSGIRMLGLAVRAILALAVVGCALPAFRYAEVAALRANFPLEALKIAPHDPKALARVLGRRFDGNPEFKPGAEDMANVRASLAAQPLEPNLLSIMGLAYEAVGDVRRASETMLIANRVSRHDSLSGLYLIESASAAGDVKATLKHYNTVLSTQPELYAVLFPILSSAIAYPEIRLELRPYLQRGGKWVPAFLAFAAEEGSVTDLQALLLPIPKNMLSDEYVPILASVLHRIAVEEGRASAERFAVAAIPGFPPASLSNLSLDPATRDKRVGQFAWNFPSTDGIQVVVSDNKSLEIRADPLARGAVAVRDLMLEAGSRYQFVQRLAHSEGSRRVDARWSADCIKPTGDMHFWGQRMLPSNVDGYVRSELVVPQGCNVVRMTLFAEGPDGQMPATLLLNTLFLAPVK